jgi:hypothetical protein
MVNGRAVQIGDVIEIPASRGLAYAQYTHEHSTAPRFGSLIRVLPGFYQEPPKTLEPLVQQAHVFVVFFPLKSAIRQGIVRRVANVPVPPMARGFPVFRDGLANPKTGKVDVWWLWDGQKSWRVGTLTEEQKSYPVRQIVNDTMLIMMIEKGVAE